MMAKNMNPSMKSQTCSDVLKYDGHVIISVISGVFMIEAQSMEKLVFNNTQIIIVFSNGEDLPSCLNSPNIGETSKKEKRLITDTV